MASLPAEAYKDSEAKASGHREREIEDMGSQVAPAGTRTAIATLVVTRNRSKLTEMLEPLGHLG